MADLNELVAKLRETELGKFARLECKSARDEGGTDQYARLSEWDQKSPLPGRAPYRFVLSGWVASDDEVAELLLERLFYAHPGVDRRTRWLYVFVTDADRPNDLALESTSYWIGDPAAAGLRRVDYPLVICRDLPAPDEGGKKMGFVKS